MDDTHDTPAAERPRARIRTLFFSAGGAALLLGASIGVYLLVSQPTSAAGPDAFQFESVYFRLPAGTTNDSRILIDAWFTNREFTDLRDVRIVAIAVENDRNLAVSKAEHAVGTFEARQTRNAVIELAINASRPHRVDLLVLVEGLMVASGNAYLGHPYVDYDVDGRVMEASQLRTHSSFDFMYRNQE